MRVVFAGTPEFAVPSLKALLHAAAVELAGVYTQPDRRGGRGKKRRQSPVKRFALAHEAPVFQPESLRDEATLTQLKRLTPDLMVVVAYGLRLPDAALAVPRLGCVNLHASILPRWRGAAPIQRAIEAGDTATGVSLMRMERGLDTGPVFATAGIPIAPDDTGGSLHDKLAPLAGELLAANLPALAAQTLSAVAQDDSGACHAPKLDKAEAELDWRLDAAALERKVRAFNPWPMAFTELNGVRMRVLRAAVATDPDSTPATARPGEVVAVAQAGISVATGEGEGGSVLVLREVQKPGGTPMPVADLLNGMEVVPGMRCVSKSESTTRRCG